LDLASGENTATGLEAGEPITRVAMGQAGGSPTPSSERGQPPCLPFASSMCAGPVEKDAGRADDDSPANYHRARQEWSARPSMIRHSRAAGVYGSRDIPDLERRSHSRELAEYLPLGGQSGARSAGPSLTEQQIRQSFGRLPFRSCWSAVGHPRKPKQPGGGERRRRD